MEVFWILYVFSKGRTTYLVSAENEFDAWHQLQKQLSWNMTLVKERCKLIKTMDWNSKVFKIKI